MHRHPLLLLIVVVEQCREKQGMQLSFDASGRYLSAEAREYSYNETIHQERNWRRD